MPNPTTKPFILSDHTKNSYGFVVFTSGIDLTDFKKNPVMLFNHCTHEVPGRWLNVHASGDSLMGTPEFDEVDVKAAELKGKVERGFINGASIGFEILEMSFSEKGFEDIPVATKTKLIEASITPLPSNSNALRVFDDKGELMTEDQIHNLIKLNRNQKLNINKNHMDLKLIAATLQLNQGASEDQVIAAINALAKKAVDANAELDTLKAEKATLTTERDGLKTQLSTQKDAQCIALVDGAIAVNKIRKDEREIWLTLSRSNYESTKLALDSRAAHVSASSQLNNNPGAGATGDEKFAALSWLETRKTPEGVAYLNRLKEGNATLFEKKRVNPSKVITE